MACIKCGKQEDLAESHIVPNFIRKRLTGEIGSNGNKKFSFEWNGTRKRTTQDLLKPHLMCRSCDSLMGSKVEKDIANLLMPKDVDIWSDWQQLPIVAKKIDGVFADSLHLGKYTYDGENEVLLDKFAILTAWRALHALALDNQLLSTRFLRSNQGIKINQTVIDYLFHDQPLTDGLSTYLYYCPPKMISFISGSEDKLPFSWIEIGEGNQISGVVVIFAFWIITWPLFDCEAVDYSMELQRFNQQAFTHGVGHVMKNIV